MIQLLSWGYNMLFRTSLGLDFLSRTIKKDKTFEMFYQDFKPVKTDYNFRLHLEAISVLLSGSDPLGLTSYTKIANDLFDDIIENKTFHKDLLSFVVYKESSGTIHNALAAIISYKQQNGLYEQYLNAVLECIEADRILGLYPINDGPNHILKSNIGIILIALLLGDHIDQAIMVSNQISKKPYFDQTIAWGLRVLYEKTGDEKYNKILKKILKEMSKIEISAMNAFVLGITQQIHLANNVWSEEVFKKQKELQIIELDKFNGAFLHNKSNPHIRIDENIINLLSFIQKQEFEESLDNRMLSMI